MVTYQLLGSVSSARSLKIETIVKVNTSLSLSLSPSSAQPGVAIKATGRLTRADGKQPQAQRVTLFDNITGATKGYANTSVDGYYTIGFTAPSTEGTYSYFTAFNGATLGGITLEPSVSAIQKITMGEPISPWIYAVGGLTLVGALWYLFLRKS